jgi:hypothetical protein
MYLCLMIAAFVLVVFIAGLERLLPYDVPTTPAPVVMPAPPTPTTYQEHLVKMRDLRDICRLHTV